MGVMDPVSAENILIFASDSLRYDYLPADIAAMGTTYKTVASSLLSPSSFASLISGMHPPRHGVYSFRHTIQAPTIFDLPGFNTSFWDASGPDIWNTLGNPPQIPLEDLEPPFIYLERQMITHLPYNRRGTAADYTIQDYLRTMVPNLAKLKADYVDGARESAERFHSRLAILKEKGVLDKTLIVFTSDHGELLGEYGVIGHSSPACPELVYVPTVFIHPAIAQGVVDNSIMGHADLVPTCLAALGEPAAAEIDGYNLFSDAIPPLRLNAAQSRLYQSQSVWDKHGGHVFYAPSPWKRLAHAFQRKIRPDISCFKLKPFDFGIVSLMAKQYKQIGAPQFGQNEAQDLIDSFAEIKVFEPKELDVDDEVRERLKHLGYLDV